MKARRFILILAAAVTLSSVAWADKSRFYEGGKVIDTMYVDSQDGLRARDFPSLKSARLCALPHRLPVKVVAVGREETIDGMTAPWVEILLPRYEWKGSEAEFGWVFGGYLSGEQPKSFAVPKTKEQLEFYLVTRDCALSHFMADGEKTTVWLVEKSITFQTSPNCDWHGEITVLSGKEFKYTHTDKNLDTSKPLDYYDVRFIITEISESTFKTKVVGKNFETSCIWEKEKRESWRPIYFASPSLYFIHFFSEMNERFQRNKDSVKCYFNESKTVERYQDEFVEELIKSGVSAKGTGNERQYHDYWNPIMAEHQKKADAMR